MHISVFTVNVKCLFFRLVLALNHLHFQRNCSNACNIRTALIIISTNDESPDLVLFGISSSTLSNIFGSGRSF